MSVETHRAELVDQSLSMPRRFRALFTLRSIGGDDAVAALLGAMTDDPSALFRHEVAFALGQMQAPGAVDVLKRVLRDATDDEMVRHECAEALGAIATEECVDALRDACVDGCRVVRETATLAMRRLEHARAKRGETKDAANGAPASKTLGSTKERLSAPAPAAAAPAPANGAPRDGVDADSPYLSVDPVPAAPASVPSDALTAVLLDESADMWDRYGAMFALRNRGDGPGVARTLGEVLGSSQSALLKHEACYVLGQLQEADATARASLVRTLEDVREHPMVRHEAAEAIGSIAAPETEHLLRKYAGDGDRIVAESCEVALDIMSAEMSGEFVPLAAACGEAAA